MLPNIVEEVRKSAGSCCIVFPIVEEISKSAGSCCIVFPIVEEVSKRDGACCIVFSNDTEAPSLLRTSPIVIFLQSPSDSFREKT